MLLDERADFLEKQSRVFRLLARGLAGLDAAQRALFDESLAFLVGLAPSSIGLLADRVDRSGFAKRFCDCSDAVRGRSSTRPTS